MVRLDDLSVAGRLAFSGLKPGVLTNHVMTADEYREDIAHGALFAHTWPGGVIFLRKREGYHMLSYIISDADIMPDCILPDDIFLEIAFKPGGADNAAKARDYWVKVGLEPIFERIRLARVGTSGGSISDNIDLANLSDANDCYDILHASFDHLTGYLPDLRELKSDIENGRIICMRDSKLHSTRSDVCGLLRCNPRVASVEIRQLAIREDMRGMGLARHLVDAFLHTHGSNKTIVWMRDGYTPALKSYTGAGFIPDGWRSVVLTKGECK